MSDQRGRGRSRAAVVLYATAFIGLYILIVFVMAVLAGNDPAKPAKDNGVVIGENVLMSLPLIVLWAIAATGLLMRHHGRRRTFLDQPFVLFLRRFSTFSDRAVVALILRQAAYNVPVVFLTPTLSRPGDWDPFLVSFAGLKLLHPWQSAPIVIRARDDAWQEAADELIRRAQTILLDVSETSGALRAEAEMLDRAGRWSDTVCLRLTAPGKDPVGGFSGVRTIDYTKSWRRALPRMAVGLLVILFVAIFFLSAMSLLVPFSVAAVITVVAFPTYYYSVFVHPTINRKAKMALRAALPPAKPPQGIGGWLILSVIDLILTPISSTYGLLTEDWPIFRDGTWEQLTTPGSAAYHALWGPLLTFEIIGGLVMIVLAIATLVLLFRKSKKTPTFAITLLSIGAIYALMLYFLLGLIPAVAEQRRPDDATIWPIASAAIWIPYFIFSRRVKATFIR
jgi:hypothetical protein